jgi:PAS domain S-box-containing protein
VHGVGFEFVALNAALAAWVGKPAQALIGRTLADLVHEADREVFLAQRDEALAAAAAGQASAPLVMRIATAAGERWVALALHALEGEPGAHWLALMQDVSVEHAARAQAQRMQGELEQWFELAGTGMLVYDEAGLILRSNAAFETMVQEVPEVLSEAEPALQKLLGWEGMALHAQLQPGGAPLERESLLAGNDGRARRLAARLACYWGEDRAERRSRRVMAVVEDRSAEDERDLAQLEMGVLMSTASVGVATFDPARGWLAQRPGAEAAGAGDALQSIQRQLVAAESLPEYDKLQRALREGARAEVRYAVNHPQLGARWLLTRVEPVALAGGRRSTSVVTLDVTEQELAQRRNAQLLRELTTILDSSTAGIAYLRGPVLVRCNRRFERMLGYAAGEAAGASLSEILAHQGVDAQTVQATLAALESGGAYEAEIEIAPARDELPPRWVALSLRRARSGEEAGADEAVAVITDISRLKSQQVELQLALREREAMFNLSDVGIVYQLGARIERANQAMAQLTGWSVPELTGLDPAALHADARECVGFEAEVARALAQDGRYAGERRLRQRDGTLRWVQVAVRPMPAEPGAGAEDAAAGTLCSYVDIDERRRAREALAQQAERTRAVLNSVLVGIVTVSEQGIEWMNRSAQRMFAGELADFAGEPISTVATPEPDHPLRRTDWWQRAREGRLEAFEARLRGRDGREFWVVGNVVASQVGAMSPQLTFALLDIDRRRQAELNIVRAQASLQRLIETAPLAIALFEVPGGQIAQANPAAAQLLGLCAAPMAGRTPAELPHAPLGRALALWLGEAAEGHAVQHEWRETLGEGDTATLRRVWDIHVAPVRAHPAAAIEQVMLLASDVTSQRAAEQARLAEAIAQREVLVREVHHRIKNNLQGVAGLLRQNAQRRPEVADQLIEAVGQVHAIAQVYGLQVGGQGGPLAVVQLVQSIAASVQRTFGRAVQVRSEALAHVLPEAEAIPFALTVNEILTNAIKHGQGEGSVSCALERAGEGLAVDVSGEGRLPEGFALERLPAGVSGLGLVRALLPRRGARLALAQEGPRVHARVELQPPSVRLPAPVDR